MKRPQPERSPADAGRVQYNRGPCCAIVIKHYSLPDSPLEEICPRGPRPKQTKPVCAGPRGRNAATATSASTTKEKAARLHTVWSGLSLDGLGYVSTQRQSSNQGPRARLGRVRRSALAQTPRHERSVSGIIALAAAAAPR